MARKPISYRAVTPHGTFTVTSTRPITVLGLGIVKRPVLNERGSWDGKSWHEVTAEAWSKSENAARSGWSGLVRYLGTYAVEIVGE